MRTKRNRGYAAKRGRSNRMYAPCRTGKDVTDQEVADVKYWVSRIRLRAEDMSRAVTLDDIHDEKDRNKQRAA